MARRGGSLYSEYSSGNNLPSLPLDQVPGTVEFAMKVFQDQDLTEHYEGGFARKVDADTVNAMGREIAELRRMCLKNDDRLGKILAILERGKHG